MQLPVHQSPRQRIQTNLQHHRPPQSPSQSKSPVGAKIPQAVGDESTAVNLHAAQNVRPMPQNQISPGVDHRMGELDQMPAGLPAQILHLVGHPDGPASLVATMKGDDDQIMIRVQFLDRFNCRGNVQQVVRVTRRGKSQQAHLLAAHGQTGHVPHRPRVSNAHLIQCVHRALTSGITKIQSVVVGQAQDMKTSILQMGHIRRGRSESITIARLAALFGLP